MPVVQKVRCQVQRIIHHGQKVYTVDLRPLSRLPRFQPGQFLHLALDEYDPTSFWPESRVFSIASPPKKADGLTVCYSVKGSFTTRMENELEEGKFVWVKLPFGEFFIPGDRDVALFAGGTGISAFNAFLESLEPTHHNNIWLFYGARDPSLLLYASLFDQIASNIPTFHPNYYIERPVDSEQQFNRPFERGLLSAASALQKIPAPEKVDFYLSGPPIMLTSLTNDLIQHGIQPDRIHIDAW